MRKMGVGNHAEDGSRSSHDVERDSTLASTVPMLESRLSALDERMDAVEPCRCWCKGDDSLSTEGILGDLSGTPEEEDVTDDGVVVAHQLRADISSLARADVNTSSNDGAPGAAVATAVAELVANIRGMAETEARAVESSLCEASATANPPEVHLLGRPISQREGDAIGVVAAASSKLVVTERPLQSFLMVTGWMHLQ